MKKNLKKIYSTLSLFLNLALILVLLFAALTYYLSKSETTPGGLRIYMISTGSMGKTIPAGSLIFVQPQESYQKDGVITYFTNDQNGQRQITPTTHRIVEIKDGENIGYQTKGDANQDPDPFLVPHQNVIGKVIFHLPFFGNFLDFSRSQLGLILLIVIPGTIIVYQQILNLNQEILRILNTKTKTKKQKKIKEK